jgi:hypothetical protein
MADLPQTECSIYSTNKILPWCSSKIAYKFRLLKDDVNLLHVFVVFSLVNRDSMLIVRQSCPNDHLVLWSRRATPISFPGRLIVVFHVRKLCYAAEHLIEWLLFL